MIPYIKPTNNPAEMIGEVNRAIGEINKVLTELSAATPLLKDYVDALASGLTPKESVHQNYLKVDNALSDIDPSVARHNLDLGELARKDFILLDTDVEGLLKKKNFPQLSGDIVNDGLSLTVNKLMGQAIPKSTLTGSYEDLSGKPRFGTGAFVDSCDIFDVAREIASNIVEAKFAGMENSISDIRKKIEGISGKGFDKDKNLQDIKDPKTARKNLGLGSFALQDERWQEYSPNIIGVSSISYSNQIGKYIQIGKFIYFSITLVVSAKFDSVIKVSLPIQSANRPGEKTLCISNLGTAEIPSSVPYTQINVASGTNLEDTITIALSGCYESV